MIEWRPVTSAQKDGKAYIVKKLGFEPAVLAFVPGGFWAPLAVEDRCHDLYREYEPELYLEENA